MTKAYDKGVAAQESSHLEPPCPYEPGTPEYTEFAEGFCAVLNALLLTGEAP